MSILIVFGIGIAAGLIAAYLGRGERRFLFMHAVVGVVGAMLGSILLPGVVAHRPYSPYHFDAEGVMGVRRGDPAPGGTQAGPGADRLIERG